jgi:hypothetical protein
MGVKEGTGVGEYNPTIDHVNNGEEASEVVFRRPSINLENRTEALKDFVNAEEVRVNMRLAEHGNQIDGLQGISDSHNDRLEVIEPILDDHINILTVIEPLALSALQPFNVVTAVADFTAETDKIYVVQPVLTTMNIQLPAPEDATVITIKDMSGFASAEVITVVRYASELIDGIAEDHIMTTPFGSVTFVSNGVDWFKIHLGGGGEGGGGPSFLQDLKFQLKDSYYNYLFWSVFADDNNEKLDATDGSFNSLEKMWELNTGEYFESSTALKENFLSSEALVSEIDVTLKYKDIDNLDPAATYEVLIGGTTYQPITMEQIGASDTFVGNLDIDRSLITEVAINEHDVLNADSVLILDDASQQKVSQEFTTQAQYDVHSKITAYINMLGTPSGSYNVKIVKDNAGSPSEAFADILWDSGAKAISELAVGANTIVLGLANNVLSPSTKYHIVFETDGLYKTSGYSSGVNEIGIQSDSTAPVIAVSKLYNGTSYSNSTEASVFKIEGYINELKLKVTASTDCLVEGFGIFFGTEDEAKPSAGYPYQLFTVIGDSNQTVFPVTEFVINPDIVKIENNLTGQAWSFPAFGIDSLNNTITVPDGTFEVEGETFLVKVYHHSAGAVDNSDLNALDLAESHIGRFATAGRGSTFIPEGGTEKVEMFIDEDGMIAFRTP